MLFMFISDVDNSYEESVLISTGYGYEHLLPETEERPDDEGPCCVSSEKLTCGCSLLCKRDLTIDVPGSKGRAYGSRDQESEKYEQALCTLP